MMISEEKHAGRLPNLRVPPSEELRLEVSATDVTFKKDRSNDLFDQDGSAIVTHQGVDNYKRDPPRVKPDRE